MSKEGRYGFSALAILLLCVTALYILVDYDKSETGFYRIGGIVSFTQYFLLSGSLLSLGLSSIGAYLNFLGKNLKRATFIGVLAYFPLIFTSFLLFYAALMFLCRV